MDELAELTNQKRGGLEAYIARNLLCRAVVMLARANAGFHVELDDLQEIQEHVRELDDLFPR